MNTTFIHDNTPFWANTNLSHPVCYTSRAPVYLTNNSLALSHTLTITRIDTFQPWVWEDSEYLPLQRQDTWLLRYMTKTCFSLCLSLCLFLLCLTPRKPPKFLRTGHVCGREIITFHCGDKDSGLLWHYLLNLSLFQLCLMPRQPPEWIPSGRRCGRKVSTFHYRDKDTRLLWQRLLNFALSFENYHEVTPSDHPCRSEFLPPKRQRHRLPQHCRAAVSLLIVCLNIAVMYLVACCDWPHSLLLQRQGHKVTMYLCVFVCCDMSECSYASSGMWWLCASPQGIVTCFSWLSQ